MLRKNTNISRGLFPQFHRMHSELAVFPTGIYNIIVSYASNVSFFLQGRKIQLLVDRYPIPRWNSRTQVQGRADIILKLLPDLQKNEQTFRAAVEETLCQSKKKPKRKKVSAVDNGADEIDDQAHTCMNLESLTAEQALEAGQLWQFLLDTDRRKYTFTSLQDKTYADLQSLSQKTRQFLQDRRSGVIPSKAERERRRRLYNRPDLYTCDCGRRATCNVCGYDFCWKLHGDLTDSDSDTGICDWCLGREDEE